MSSSNQAEIQASFTRQAEDFESRRMSFSKADYLAYVVSKIAPTKEATVLEVAAGTGVCGRALAPHVRNCSRTELLALYAAHGLTADCCETTRIPVDAESWLELTHTPPPVREEIRRRFTDELNGGEKTGFAPYTVSGQLRFDQQWLLLIGRKG